MMLLLLKLIFITYIIVVTYIAASQEDMLLSGVRRLAQEAKDDGYKIAQIFLCPWCAPSLFTLIGFACAWGLGVLNVFMLDIFILYFLTVCGASVASGLTWSVYEMVNAKKDYYKSLVQYEE